MSKFTKYVGKFTLMSFVLILSISLYTIYSLNIYYKESESIQSMDSALILTKNLLEEEELRALSLSILLSQNKEFLKEYFSKNRRATFDVINKKINTLKMFQNYNFEVQVHDKNLNTYIRNWDFNITDIPLSSFREGLVLTKKRKAPLVSIENGKRLNIKAISPILKDGEFVGSIEVIQGFEHLRKKLLEHGYNLFILLNKNNITSDKKFKDYKYINDEFILVNELYEKNSYNALKNSNLKNLKAYGYFSQDDFYFGYFEINNFNNKGLGYCIVSFENINQLYLKSHYKHTVFDDNSSKVTIR